MAASDHSNTDVMNLVVPALFVCGEKDLKWGPRLSQFWQSRVVSSVTNSTQV